MKRKHTIFAFLFLISIQLIADENPSIKKMWSRVDGVKSTVYDVDDDSVSINFSELNKWTASNIKMYSIVTPIDPIAKNGRIIITKDSIGVSSYCLLDYFKLTDDSIRMYQHPQNFADIQQAKQTPIIDEASAKTFYTTEYLYLEKVAKSAPAMRKDDYINFLKAAELEAKMQAKQSKLDLDIKKPIDKRVEAFLFAFAKEKRYKGKIFPHTLDAAIKKYAKDEAMKKLISPIKVNFVVKKTADVVTPTKGGNVKAKPKTTNAPADKTKNSNGVQIKTEK